MAATTGRLLVMTVVLLVGAVACSEPTPEEILNEAMADAAATSTTTSSTVPSSTTTTEPTTTTLSERDLAKAEIEQVVVDWYQLPIDSTQEEFIAARLEPLTGLLRQRIIEAEERLEGEGVVRRSRQVAPIEVTDIDVNIEGGTAEVNACTGSAVEFVRVETGEVVGLDDPSETFASAFYLELDDDRWRINEWIPSRTDGDLIDCDFGA